MNLDEAFKTCPMEFKPMCNVVHSSCAWIVDCPGLSGMVFKTIEEAKIMKMPTESTFSLTQMAGGEGKGEVRPFVFSLT